MKRVLSNSYRGYTANISFDEEKSVYVGAVEEADIGFYGRTVDEAIKRFHIVVDRHINYGG